MEQYKLFDSEYKFACIIWEYEPVGSGDLVRLCNERLGWKKSTTYTVLKKLCERGILRNDNSIVTAIIGREEALKNESRTVIDKTFGGSLPQFLSAFLEGKKISEQEALELKRIIDRYKEN